MSLSQALSIAMSGLRANQLALLDKRLGALQTIKRERFFTNVIGDITEIVVLAMTG